MKTKLIFGILFLSLSADYLCQGLATDTLRIGSYVSDEVQRRELITVRTNGLTIKSKALDAFIAFQSDCTELYADDRLSHFTMVLDTENQQLRIFFEEGIPEQKAALCGVYFHGDKRMPYLIYSNNGTHDLFQAAQDMVVIQYFKLYNVENEDISNQIQLIDERKIHTGIFSENNLELNYYIESCY
jgi:hypothetical protein